MKISILLLLLSIVLPSVSNFALGDHIRKLQSVAADKNAADWGHWGCEDDKYSSWFSHSNRLIPVYTFGIGLDEFRGPKSVYRDEDRVKKLYGYVPEGTLNPQAEYFDQTDIAKLQLSAAAAGKKRIILFVFDGMDWQTTWNAAIHAAGKVGYTSGRGTGLGFQDYRGAKTDFGYFATSPHNEGTKVDVNTQTLKNPGGTQRGGYNWNIAGVTPWTRASILNYCIGQCEECSQAYTDSASSASSLCAGVKTFNDSINVDPVGRQVDSVARKLQKQGFSVGVVSSVPISHATPAAAYANNVHRDDYQDLTRDLLGLPSISHPDPLPGVDVLIGSGWGEEKKADKAQGENYIPGNTFVTSADMEAVDVSRSPNGRYRVVQRSAGKNGRDALFAAAEEAAQKGERLFGYFGAAKGHLPFETADGDYKPTHSVKARAEVYTEQDLNENPKLADFAVAALNVLSTNKQGFWLMVESGDVDWANHANNIDNSIGAVNSGDKAFKAVCKWIESHGGWDDTALILTADHGHYFFLEKPEALLPADSSVTAAK